jgi:hypothetical protein
VARVIALIFNLYALGLIVYVVLLFAHWTQGKLYAAKMQKFYDPFLIPLRQLQKNTELKRFNVDLSPALLLLAIILVRILITMLLTSA